MIKTFSRVPLYYYDYLSCCIIISVRILKPGPQQSLLRSENFYIKVKLAPHDEAVSR